MHTRRWHRVSARIVLATFSTCFVACGGPQGEAPTPTTVPAAQPPPTPPPTVPPTLPPTLPPPSPTLPSQAPAQLGTQELRDLVAPVALYPDVVLASLLPATTHGDQVQQAAQYVGQAQHVDQIPEDRGWDGSVVALLQFPDVLRWLDNNPAWTDQMGMAVTYQQADVLQAIQDYRHTVRDVGNLKSNQYQQVSGGEGGQNIRIAPAQPSVVYVPSYDPVAAVQPQPPVEQAAAAGINPWLAFGGGAVVGALGAWALYSIFDNDDHGHQTINTYNNYYYGGGHRGQSQNWQAQQRPYQNRPRGDWQRTRRLDYATQTQPVKAGAGLRPPMTRPGAAAAGTAAPTPQQVQREQRQQRQAERQQHQQEMRQQQQQQRTQKLEQRQERQAEKQRTQIEQRQQHQAEKQQHKAERQQKQVEQRQQQQEQRQQHQMERQQHQAEQQQQRQERQKAQQEQRQQRQMQQQEQRQQHQEQRQEQHKQQAQEQGGKKKKKQGQ